MARRALQAGKHVMLEKPVGPSVADALQVLAAHRALPRPPVWLVAENYRCGAGGAPAGLRRQAAPAARRSLGAQLPPWQRRCEGGSRSRRAPHRRRFEAVFQEACRQAGSLGTIIKLDLAADLPMDERNKCAPGFERDACPVGPRRALPCCNQAAWQPRHAGALSAQAGGAHGAPRRSQAPSS